jgi:hypothetical protein
VDLNWLWLIPALGFAIFETLALLNEHDRFQPATYWIRRAFNTRNRWGPLYYLIFGVWVWLGVHFLVEV